MQALTNLDILYLLFGTTTTLLAYSVHKKFAAQTKKNNELVENIKKLRKQSKKLQYYDKIKKISSTDNKDHKDQKLNVVIQDISPNIKCNTMVIRKRELPLHVKENWVYENVSGGNFSFTYQTKQIFTDIIDTTVLSSILSTNSNDVSIFGHMRPVVKRVQYYLGSRQKMAIVGVLSYDIATNKLKLQPMVMGQSIKQIIEFYQLKSIYPWALRIFTILGMGLGLWFAYTPLKKIFKRIFNHLPYFRNKFQPKQQQQILNNLQYFKNRVQIKTSQQNTFVCVLCKQNTTVIIYKCGHLSVCEGCHQRNKQINQGKVICPTCYKVSNKDIKIYFG